MKQTKYYPSQNAVKKSLTAYNKNRKQKLTRAEKKAKRNTHINKYKEEKNEQ